MAEDYLDFDLRIWKGPNGYAGSAAFSGSGGSGLETLSELLRHRESERPRSGGSFRDLDGVRGHGTETAHDFGRRLFEAVFHGKIRSFWILSRERARQAGKGIRLRLILQSPELWEWPWEYLCDQDDEFLIFSSDLSIVRSPEVPRIVIPARIERPLQVLVAIAQPRGTQELGFERELTALSSHLATLKQVYGVEMRVLRHASRAKLRQDLKKPVHIFHFIGHGSFDRVTGKGFLLLEKDNEVERMTGKDLGQLLKAQPALALVVLNACESGRADESDPFAGVAQGLVRAGIAAVLAMQSRVADEAALTFTKAFYEAFAKGDPLDRAVYEARESLFQEGFEAEWGNPVLYLRSEGFRVSPKPLNEDERADNSDGKPATVQWKARWKKYRWAMLAALLIVLSFGITYWLLPPHPFVTSDPGCPSILGMPFARVPAGSVLIPDPEDKRTIRSMQVDQPFCISKFEVTQRQWRELGLKNNSRLSGRKRPVEGVSWREAALFILRLNEKDRSRHYRLPSLSEWLRAAQAGGIPDPGEMTEFGNCGGEDGYRKTAPIGIFKPNSLGIYDLFGNVWEWLSDPYVPMGGGPPREMSRIGGSFGNKPEICTDLKPTGSPPDRHFEAIGVRIVSDFMK